MTRTIESHRQLVGAMVFALLMFPVGTALAEESEKSLLEVFSITDETFSEMSESDSPHGPTNSSAVLPGPGWQGAGVHRFEKGETWLKEWPYWYHEFVYVTRGRGKITVSVPPYTTSESKNVKAGDLFTLAPSMKVSFEALGDDTFEIVWAVPE